MLTVQRNGHKQRNKYLLLYTNLSLYYPFFSISLAKMKIYFHLIQEIRTDITVIYLRYIFHHGKKCEYNEYILNRIYRIEYLTNIHCPISQYLLGIFI